LLGGGEETSIYDGSWCEKAALSYEPLIPGVPLPFIPFWLPRPAPGLIAPL
jgi:hypothetical protein